MNAVTELKELLAVVADGMQSPIVSNQREENEKACLSAVMTRLIGRKPSKREVAAVSCFHY